jgi:hypothetical protein
MIRSRIECIAGFLSRIAAVADTPYRKWLGYAVSLAGLGLIVYVVLSDYGRVMVALASARWQGLVAALCLNLIALPILPLCWHHLLRRCGHNLPVRLVLAIYSLTAVVRYLPGGIWHFGGRLVWLGQLSVSPWVAGQTIAAEQVLVLWSALVTAVFCIFTPSLEDLVRQVWLGFLCLILLVAGSLMLGWLLVHCDRHERRSDLGILGLAGGYTAFWLLQGISLCAVVSALGRTGANLEWLQVVGYGSLAWAVGFLVVFAPSGLGIREGVLAASLAVFVPLPTAAAIALLTRLLLLISEGTWVFVAACLQPRHT